MLLHHFRHYGLTNESFVDHLQEKLMHKLYMDMMLIHREYYLLHGLLLEFLFLLFDV